MARVAVANPAALSPAELAGILVKAGSKAATEELIRRHLAMGAPLNPDGTLHLVHYTAWLVRQIK